MPMCHPVQDHGVREELLIHIAKEATAVRDAGWRALKVVSDIDDTFLCSGGSFPSGTVAAPGNAEVCWNQDKLVQTDRQCLEHTQHIMHCKASEF